MDESYGIEVAKLAGIPQEIVKRSKEILHGLEGEAESTGNAAKKSAAARDTDSDGLESLSIMDLCRDSVCDRIKEVDINTLTPIEAMNLIFDWKKTLGS